MQTIWKFPLAITDAQTVAIPRGARILSVQAQVDTPTLWALVDPEAAPVLHAVSIFGTGNPIGFLSRHAAFVGTVQTHGGSLVWHVFVEGPETLVRPD